ncbi:MAG TPA: M28 family peptidase [Longimicrobiales bacterium]|nr:M28 family peptidase [Longimicrobiales bacterium]
MWTNTIRAAKALLLAGTAIACGAAGSPDARQAGASAALAALAADSATILDDLRYLSSDELQGRATGSEGAARARDRLAERFSGAGLATLGGQYAHPFEWSPRGSSDVRPGVNLVGLARGTELAQRFIVVSGHYDHVGVLNGEVYNGADDNASGAVGVAALARALSGTALRHSILFVSFDAEEVGLEGARAFVAAPPVPLDAIVLDVNLDMVARTGGVLWAGGAYHTPALRPILEDVARRAPVDYRLGHDAPGAPEGADWTRQSDQEAFRRVGIPFVYLGVDDHPDYHHPTDDFELVDPGEYMNALRAALLTVLALDAALPFPETLP